MDSAKPHSLGSLLNRITCLLGGLLLIYVPSMGPAAYFAVKHRGSQRLVKDFYAPLIITVEWMHMQRPFDHYLVWWESLAGLGVHKRTLQPPPKQP